VTECLCAHGRSVGGCRLAIKYSETVRPSMILKYICSSFEELPGPSSSARCMRAIWPLSLLSHPASLAEAPAVSQWSLVLFSLTFVLVSCTHSTHAHSALAVVAEASRDSVTITEARRNRIIACPFSGPR